MLTTKIRTAIAVGAVGAALASSGVASAASITPQSSTTTNGGGRRADCRRADGRVHNPSRCGG